MARTRLVAALCGACMLLVSMALAPGGARAASTLPPQGIFESCPLNTELAVCEQRLKLIHEAGFRVVVFPVGGASLLSLWNYAGEAYALHMSIMWELSSSVWWTQPPSDVGAAGQFPAFASACKCEQNAWVLVWMVRWLGALPQTYGYYAADDSALADGGPGQLGYYVRAIKTLDPNHPVMIGTADTTETAQYEGIPDLIGAEIYPFTTTSLLPIAPNQPEWDAVAQEVTQSQQMADAANKHSAFILQAFSWGDNLADGIAVGGCTSADTAASCYAKLHYPTSFEQLALRNSVLEHAHPQLILWWSCPGTAGAVGGNQGTTYPSGSVAAAQWKGLAWAIQAPAPGAFARDLLAHRARSRRHRHRRHHRRQTSAIAARA